MSPPRKTAASQPQLPEPIPSDAEILDAIAEHRRLWDEHKAAYDAYMAARKRLTAVLDAAGAPRL